MKQKFMRTGKRRQQDLRHNRCSVDKVHEPSTRLRPQRHHERTGRLRGLEGEAYAKVETVLKPVTKVTKQWNQELTKSKVLPSVFPLFHHGASLTSQLDQLLTYLKRGHIFIKALRKEAGRWCTYFL